MLSKLLGGRHVTSISVLYPSLLIRSIIGLVDWEASALSELIYTSSTAGGCGVLSEVMGDARCKAELAFG